MRISEETNAALKKLMSDHEAEILRKGKRHGLHLALSILDKALESCKLEKKNVMGVAWAADAITAHLAEME